MPTAKEAYDAKKSDSTPLLHGSDLPRTTGKITVKCTGIRLAPDQFNSPAILDFEPIKIAGNDFAAIALNKTNMRAIMEMFGEDVELDGLKGSVTFQRVIVNNPQTKKPAHGLLLIEFDRGRATKKKPVKAGPASRRGGKKRPVSDEDVPF